MNCETFHYDNARTGWLKRDPLATPGRPSTPPWGKYAQLELGSPVRGAVMFLQNWTLRGGQHQGQTHTMLYFATSANEVFAFSEEQLRAGNLTPIWKKNLAPASMRGGSNIPTPVGVAGSVVLDPQHRQLFVMALTANGRQPDTYHIYALDLDTGGILADEAIIDGGSSGRPTFVGQDHDQRGALLLAGGRAYGIFADFQKDDRGPYRGWLVGCKADNLADQWFLPLTNQSFGGGVWGPGGATADDQNRLYVVTGNGTDGSGNANTDDYWDGLGGYHPGDLGDFFEAVVRAGASQRPAINHWDAPIQIPGWFGSEDQHGAIAVADLNGDSSPELVVLHIDNPSGANHGYYRIGWGLNGAGHVTGGWSAPIEIPGWFGDETQGAGVAIADLNGDHVPELIVFHIDDPSGGNNGYYRIGWGLNSAGQVTGGWSTPVKIPGWWGNDNQGGGIAVADANGDGVPELIVFHIDNPSGENHGFYRIGWGLDSAGNITGGWTGPTEIPGWFGSDNQGGGIAVGKLSGSSALDLIVFHIDNPSGGNHGYYRIGWGLDSTGTITGAWSDPVQVPGWFGNDNQGGGIAVADLNGNGFPELIVFHIDDPSGANHGYYRVGWDLTSSPILAAYDWYLPKDARPLNDSDSDLGGSSALLLPIFLPSGGQLLVTSDKAGNVYLLNSLNLGHWGGELWRKQSFSAEARCTPAYYRTDSGDHMVFLSSHGNPGLIAFRVDGAGTATPQLVEVWRAHDGLGHVISLGAAAGSPIVVSTQATGRQRASYSMVWVLDGEDDNPRALYAFNALDGVELYNSSAVASDNLPSLPHYPPMNCSEHSVFVGTNSGLACFRLPRIQPATTPQFVAFHIDDPSGANHGYYRLGWDVGGGGSPSRWDQPVEVPGWFGNDNQAGSIAAHDLNGDGMDELIVFHIDHPSGGNHGFYRIGWNVDAYGTPAFWGPPVQIPGWWGNENAGGGIAVADLNGDSVPELIVFHIDNPSGANDGYYRIGWGLDASGNITGGWSDPVKIPGWWGNDSAGGGIAVADLNGDSIPEFVVFHIDDPSGANHGYYRVGWRVDGAGHVTNGWGNPVKIPGWWGNDNQGGGIAIADLNGDSTPELVVFHIDNPPGANHGYYRIGWGIDSGGNVGAWSDPAQIPGWYGNENSGGGIAVARWPWTWVWV